MVIGRVPEHIFDEYDIPTPTTQKQADIMQTLEINQQRAISYFHEAFLRSLSPSVASTGQEKEKKKAERGKNKAEKNKKNYRQLLCEKS